MHGSTELADYISFSVASLWILHDLHADIRIIVWTTWIVNARPRRSEFATMLLADKRLCIFKVGRTDWRFWNLIVGGDHLMATYRIKAKQSWNKESASFWQ